MILYNCCQNIAHPVGENDLLILSAPNGVKNQIALNFIIVIDFVSFSILPANKPIVFLFRSFSKFELPECSPNGNRFIANQLAISISAVLFCIFTIVGAAIQHKGNCIHLCQDVIDPSISLRCIFAIKRVSPGNNHLGWGIFIRFRCSIIHNDLARQRSTCQRQAKAILGIIIGCIDLDIAVDLAIACYCYMH